MAEKKRVGLIREYYDILNEWMHLIEENQNIGRILTKIGVKQIAIYGMGSMAIHIINMLKNSDIEVVCVMDSEPLVYYDVKTSTIDNEPLEVDLIIYTNPNEDDEVLEKLKKISKVMYIGDVIFDNIKV